MTTASLKVIGVPQSTCSRRVLTVLEELKVPYTLQPIDFSKGEHKNPEYIAKQQPFGQVPVLWDGDYHLYESRAIIRYLASAYDSSHKLLPTTPKLLGEVEQWISVENCNYRVDDIVYEYVFKKYSGGGEPDAVKVEAALKKATRVLEVLENHLSAKKDLFLVGDHFTVADVVYMPYTGYFLEIKEFSNTLEKYPHVLAWWKNITSRPSWQTVISKK